MSERWPEDSGTYGEQSIHSGSYQSTALELLYASLARARDNSVTPPTDGEHGIFLDPPEDFDKDYTRSDEPDEGWGPWEAIEVTVYPEDFMDEHGRNVQASIMFNQFYSDDIEGVYDMEWIKRYDLLFCGSKYMVESRFFIYDYALSDDIDKAMLATDIRYVVPETELAELTRLLNSATV